jgi:hypothetical protein
MMVAAGCGLASLVGCQGMRSRVAPRMEAVDPGERAAAIIAAGNARDCRAVPALVDRLEDEDPGVRFFAVLALERLTGTRLGYRSGAPLAERRAAVQEWRKFLASGPGAGEATSLGGEGH